MNISVKLRLLKDYLHNITTSYGTFSNSHSEKMPFYTDKIYNFHTDNSYSVSNINGLQEPLVNQ